MFDALRDHIQTFLAGHQQCVMTARDGDSTATLLARYHADGLCVDCLLPLWAEITYCLEHNPQVTLVIPPGDGDAESWMQVQGRAEALAAPEWHTLLPMQPAGMAPADLFRVVRVRPRRIDLIDERRGWGARETLELP